MPLINSFQTVPPSMMWLQMKTLPCVFHFKHTFWVRKETAVYFNSATPPELRLPSKLLLGCSAASKRASDRLFSK